MGAWRYAARWMLLAALLNLAWEVAQLPFYTLYEEGSATAIAYAIAHCTIGDVLIAVACYCAAALVVRDLRWPLVHPASGAAIAVAIGVAYTGFSEWLNVSVRASWEYAATMPTLYGVGLSPLLQWLLIPPLMVFLVRGSRPHP